MCHISQQPEHAKSHCARLIQVLTVLVVLKQKTYVYYLHVLFKCNSITGLKG